MVLKCNYEESPTFASPIYFSPFMGKEIAAGEARKWSIDDMAAYVCKRVERKITSLAGGGRTGMSGEDALDAAIADYVCLIAAGWRSECDCAGSLQ